MKAYTEAERCLLLLCALPGETAPVPENRYRSLMRAAVNLGPENRDMEAPLDLRELRRLGCGPAEAENILSRLDRTAELELYLRFLEDNQIRAVTRLSPEYPKRLLDKLGDRAPLTLFCAGELRLFSGDFVSLVGSRRMRKPGQRFAQAAGRAAAKQGFGYCSGGAAGADTEGFLAADRAGGSAVIFLADSLLRQRTNEKYRRALSEGRLLLVSESGPDQVFSAQRALSRNHLIHAFGKKVLVAQTDYGTGGTWHGCADNLKAGWSPVFMYDGEPEDPGARGLLERGASPVSLPALERLEALTPAQTSLFS